MTDYCDIGDLEDVLRETVEDTDLEELADKCITTASALVDAFLKVRNMAVPDPSSPPQLIVEATAWFAAWELRRTSDPINAEAFWVEAQRFLQTYIDAEEPEDSLPFKVGSD